MFEYVKPSSIYPKPTIINNISINGGLSKPTIDTNVIEAGWAQKSPNMFSLATFSLKDQHFAYEYWKTDKCQWNFPSSAFQIFRLHWLKANFIFIFIFWWWLKANFISINEPPD